MIFNGLINIIKCINKRIFLNPGASNIGNSVRIYAKNW
jgi:hypothetical protein